MNNISSNALYLQKINRDDKKTQFVQQLTFYAIETESNLPKKFIGDVKVGFPSPDGDFMNEIIDLNKYVTLHPAATYYARANGVSMEGDINDGDLLVIDKSITLFSTSFATKC